MFDHAVLLRIFVACLRSCLSVKISPALNMVYVGLGEKHPGGQLARFYFELKEPIFFHIFLFHLMARRHISRLWMITLFSLSTLISSIDRTVTSRVVGGAW